MQIISAANTSVTRGMPPTHTYNLPFGPGLTINPNAHLYNHLTQSMALQEALPFMLSWNEITLNQTDDDSYEWLSGFKQQISFYTNENVMDRSRPFAISMTSQSGVSDVMLDGLNYLVPAGTNVGKTRNPPCLQNSDS
jgi:hypothetical protein